MKCEYISGVCVSVVFHSQASTMRVTSGMRGVYFYLYVMYGPLVGLRPINNTYYVYMFSFHRSHIDATIEHRTRWPRTIPSRRSRYRIQPIKCTFFPRKPTRREENGIEIGTTTTKIATQVHRPRRSAPKEDFVSIYFVYCSVEQQDESGMSSAINGKFYIWLYISVAGRRWHSPSVPSIYFLFSSMHLNRKYCSSRWDPGPSSRVSIAN